MLRRRIRVRRPWSRVGWPVRRGLAAAILLMGTWTGPSESAANEPPAPCPDLDALDAVGVAPSLWLRADCVDGTGEIPADGTSIGSWEDVSGNDNDAVTLAGQGDPTVESGPGEGISGQPTLRFTRTSNTSGTVLEVAGMDIRPSARPDISVFVVYRTAASDPGQTNEAYGVFGADDGSWDRFFLAIFEPGFGNGSDEGLISLGPTASDLSNSAVTGAGTPDEVRLLTVVYDGAVTGGTNSGPVDASRVYFDGELIRSFSDSTHATAARDNLYIGWDGDDNPFAGEIAEFIVFDTALDESLTTLVTDYLDDKYGLQLTPTSAVAWDVVDEDPDTTDAVDLPFAAVAQAWSTTLATSGGTADYSFEEVTAGESLLPGGITIGSTDAASGTITLTGTPTSGGLHEFTLRVTDADGVTADATFRLAVTQLEVTPVVLAWPAAGDVRVPGPRVLEGGQLLALCAFASDASGTPSVTQDVAFDVATSGMSDADAAVGSSTIDIVNDMTAGMLRLSGGAAGDIDALLATPGLRTVPDGGLAVGRFVTLRAIPYRTTAPDCGESPTGTVDRPIEIRALGATLTARMRVPLE